MGAVAIAPGFVVILLGLLVKFSGDFYLAVKEIALNTRRSLEEASSSTDYSGLLILAKAVNAVGWILMISGGIAILVGVISAAS